MTKFRIKLLDSEIQELNHMVGQPTRIDYHYKRKGTRNIFVAVEPKAGKRVTRITVGKQS